ncbi:MAG: choice-of-anchor P family protein [Nocardioides sp.]
MTTRRTLARASAALASAALGLTGTVALTSTPAQASTTVTDYGFQTLGYGTQVRGNAVNVQSGRTAFTYVMCTRLTGVRHTDSVTTVNVPSDTPAVHAEGVSSVSRTYRTSTGNVGTTSVDKIAKLVLGQPGHQIVIKGLVTTTNAWADKAGKLHASNRVSSVSLTSNTGTPLDAALPTAGATVNDLIAQINQNGGSYPVTGLGTLYAGASFHSVHSSYAKAGATALRVRLDSADATVTIGRSWSRINRGLPAGVMSGAGYGADVPSAVSGVAKVGRLAVQPLPCQGTHGNILASDLAGMNLGNANALQLGAISGRSWGVQRQDGYAKGWTKGGIAKVVLGPLEIDGIVGKATVTKGADGRFHRSTAYTIGKLIVNGKEQGSIPAPGQPLVVGSGGQDVLEVRFGTSTLHTRSAQVNAVIITALTGIDGVPQGAVIRLGNARTSIKRY